MRDDDPWSGLTPPREPASGGGVGAVLREFHIPWPTANEASLREAATIWHQLAETFRDNYGLANRAATSVTSNNEGAAIRAFEQYWDKYGSRSKGALPLAADACDSMSNACSKYADEVSAVKQQIDEGIAALVAAVVLGTATAVLTFGVTESAVIPLAEAFASTAARLVSALGAAGWTVEVGQDFATTIGIIDDAAGNSIASAADDVAYSITNKTYVGPLTKGIASSVGGLAGGVGGAAASDVSNDLLGGDKLTRSQVMSDLAVSGLEGGANSVLGSLGGLTATQLSRELDNAAQAVMTDDPQLFMSMKALSRQVSGVSGKVSASLLASAAAQLVSAQQITGQTLVSDQLQDRIQEAAGRDEG